MTTRPRLPAAVWALGFVSLLMDVSSELVHSLLPVFLVTALGASALVVGLIEGAAEATALIVKVFSGVLSDYWGRRKPLAVLGYGLGALSKPLFALATGAGLVLAARLIDRVCKGIRGAPRDALVADIAPPDLRGTAFGFFNLVSGIALLFASVLAGLLWDRLGAAATFLAGAGLSLLAMVTVLASPVGARRAGG
jgi:MFS family permease